MRKPLIQIKRLDIQFDCHICGPGRINGFDGFRCCRLSVGFATKDSDRTTCRSYAGMMELADMRDLGAVTSVKVSGRRTPAEMRWNVDM